MCKLMNIPARLLLIMLFMLSVEMMYAQVIPPRKPATSISSSSTTGRVSTVGKPKPVEAKKDVNPYDQFGQYKAKVDVYGRPIPSGTPKKQAITQRTRTTSTVTNNSSSGTKGSSSTPKTGYRYYGSSAYKSTSSSSSGLSDRYKSTSYQSKYSRERANSSSTSSGGRYYSRSSSGSSSGGSSTRPSYYQRSPSSSSGGVHTYYHYTKPSSLTKPASTSGAKH
jgi:hypothetical protein